MNNQNPDYNMFPPIQPPYYPQQQLYKSSSTKNFNRMSNPFDDNKIPDDNNSLRADDKLIRGMIIELMKVRKNLNDLKKYYIFLL